MIRKLYDFTIRLAETRFSLLALAVVSFLEGFIFPVPPDALLAPIALARPSRAWLAAGICLAASVAGGVAGYLIGAVFMEEVGNRILQLYNLAGGFSELSDSYNEQGHLAVLIGGLTPVPYKLVAIFSGATGLSLALFVAISVFARGLRFFLVAALIWKYGDAARHFIERHLTLLFVCFTALAVAGFLVIGVL